MVVSFNMVSTPDDEEATVKANTPPEGGIHLFIAERDPCPPSEADLSPSYASFMIHRGFVQRQPASPHRACAPFGPDLVRMQALLLDEGSSRRGRESSEGSCWTF